MSEKFIYSIGYSSYEESDYTQLFHEKKFSREELKTLIFGICKDIILSHEKYEYIGLYDHYNDEFSLNFQDLLDPVVKILTERYGFEEIKFQTSFSLFGWANVLEQDGWEHERDNELNELTSLLESDDKIKGKIKEIKKRLKIQYEKDELEFQKMLKLAEDKNRVPQHKGEEDEKK